MALKLRISFLKGASEHQIFPTKHECRENATAVVVGKVMLTAYVCWLSCVCCVANSQVVKYGRYYETFVRLE